MPQMPDDLTTEHLRAFIHDESIHQQIFDLFKKLPVDRQSALLDELHEFLENDDSDDKTRDLGTCCCCLERKPIKKTQNLGMLPNRTPYGFGWGCLVCNLPSEGAFYICCDDCFDNDAKPKEFVKGGALNCERASISELGESFEHDLALHAAYDKASFQSHQFQ